MPKSKQLARLLAEKRSTYFNFWGIVPLPGKKWLELPILDALNSPRKIDNLWSEGLDRPAGSFGRVPRFDRCTTCHQGIQKSLPASADQPALCESIVLELALQLPTPRRCRKTADVDDDSQQLEAMFGIALATEGLLDPDDVTIRFVHPAGLGRKARRWSDIGIAMRAGDIREQLLLADQGTPDEYLAAGFLVGDTIVAVDGQPGSRRRGGTAMGDRAVDQLPLLLTATSRDSRCESVCDVACLIPMPGILAWICLWATTVLIRWLILPVRSAMKGRGVRRRSSGRPMHPTTLSRVAVGVNNMVGSITRIGSIRCIHSGLSKVRV